MKLSIYNIHNTEGDQFADVEASSKAEALEIFQRVKGGNWPGKLPALRARKLQGDDIVSRDVIRSTGKWEKLQERGLPTACHTAIVYGVGCGRDGKCLNPW